MYKLITSVRDTDDLSIVFDRDRGRRQRELTNNKKIRGKNHVRIYLKDIFGFANYQEKASFGLGYNLTLTRNVDNSVLNKANATIVGTIKFNAMEWYVPHFTLSISTQKLLPKQILSKVPTELQYVERSVFMKEITTQNIWTFELGTGEGINLPIWIFVGFQQRDRQDSQNLNNGTFYKPSVINSQCFIKSENYPDSVILINYDDDEYSQGYGQIKEASKALTEDDILQPYISDNDFRSSDIINGIGYKLYVFEMRCQKN